MLTNDSVSFEELDPDHYNYSSKVEVVTFLVDPVPEQRRMNGGFAPNQGRERGQRAPAIHTVKEDPNMPDSDVIVSLNDAVIQSALDMSNTDISKYRLISDNIVCTHFLTYLHFSFF